jgi:hypothetical protein
MLVPEIDFRTIALLERMNTEGATASDMMKLILKSELAQFITKGVSDSDYEDGVDNHDYDDSALMPRDKHVCFTRRLARRTMRILRALTRTIKLDVHTFMPPERVRSQSPPPSPSPPMTMSMSAFSVAEHYTSSPPPLTAPCAGKDGLGVDLDPASAALLRFRAPITTRTSWTSARSAGERVHVQESTPSEKESALVVAIVLVVVVALILCTAVRMHVSSTSAYSKRRLDTRHLFEA